MLIRRVTHSSSSWQGNMTLRHETWMRQIVCFSSICSMRWPLFPMTRVRKFCEIMHVLVLSSAYVSSLCRCGCVHGMFMYCVDCTGKFTVLIDRTGAGMSNQDIELVKSLGAIWQDNFPERVCRFIVYPTGMVFYGTFLQYM